jgi:hypothetical protein
MGGIGEYLRKILVGCPIKEVTGMFISYLEN